MWVEDEASVRQIVCDYLTGQIFPRTWARRMFPMFNQQQLEEMAITTGKEEVVENEATYEPFDDIDERDDDWMDTP